MSEVQYTLKAFRDDQIGFIYEQEVLPTDDHLSVANGIAERFGLGRYLDHNISGAYSYEDGEILTYFQLTPLR